MVAKRMRRTYRHPDRFIAQAELEGWLESWTVPIRAPLRRFVKGWPRR